MSIVFSTEHIVHFIKHRTQLSVIFQSYIFSQPDKFGWRYYGPVDNGTRSSTQSLMIHPSSEKRQHAHYRTISPISHPSKVMLYE